MTLGILDSLRDNNYPSKMTELIPEVIPVRTKMSCPVDRAISQAKATMDLLATLALKRKKKARETRSRMRTMTTIVIFDEYLSRCHFKKKKVQ